MFKRKFGVALIKLKKFPTLSALIKIDYSPDPDLDLQVHTMTKVEGETTHK